MRYTAYVRDGFDLAETERLIHELGGTDAYTARHGSGQISFEASETVAERVRTERCIVTVMEDIVVREPQRLHHNMFNADD